MRLKMIISFIVAIAFMGLFIWGLTNFSYLVSYIFLLGTFIFFAVFSYNALRMFGRQYPSKEKGIMKAYLWAMFAFYLYFLFQLTFNVNRADHLIIFQNKELLDAYLRNYVNFVPFKSIIGAFVDHYSVSYILVNIFGNIAALAPMGFFLPRLFSFARKLIPFIITTSLAVVFIEFTQFLFTVGSVDIDDLILNVTGAVIVFLILRIEPVKKLVEKLFPN